MRMYKTTTEFNCGIDLHSRCMYACVVDREGKVLAMTILFEIGEIARFPRHHDLASYARLVRGTVASAGKIEGMRGAKMGNGYLKWAFKEAVLVAKRAHPEIRAMYQRLEAKLYDSE